MSQGVTILFPRFPQSRGAAVPRAPGTPDNPVQALTKTFATRRQPADSVYWLKENAELLGVLAASGTRVAAEALQPYAAFYADVENRMTFFPQYYRFFLSLAMDCEDLGLPGQKSLILARQVAASGLPAHELSDLQRAEAARLLRRRGVDAFPDDPGLEHRVRRFCAQSRHFALPNRKAAYELTHAVFYLSEYGRCDPRLDPAVGQSLRYAGTVAYLDRDADLLAEICIALRYAGHVPPAAWEGFVAAALAALRWDVANPAPQGDDYHAFLMAAWSQAAAGRPDFNRSLPDVNFAVRMPRPEGSPLRDLSAWLLRCGRARSGDWAASRAGLMLHLHESAAGTLAAAETAVEDFDVFYAHFARATFQDQAA